MWRPKIARTRTSEKFLGWLGESNCETISCVCGTVNTEIECQSCIEIHRSHWPPLHTLSRWRRWAIRQIVWNLEVNLPVPSGVLPNVFLVFPLPSRLICSSLRTQLEPCASPRAVTFCTLERCRRALSRRPSLVASEFMARKAIDHLVVGGK